MYFFQVLVGNYDESVEWTSVVEGLFHIGQESLIAHFKLAGMHIALEKSLIVKPRTGGRTTRVSIYPSNYLFICNKPKSTFTL